MTQNKFGLLSEYKKIPAYILIDLIFIKLKPASVIPKKSSIAYAKFLIYALKYIKSQRMYEKQDCGRCGNAGNLF